MSRNACERSPLNLVRRHGAQVSENQADCQARRVYLLHSFVSSVIHLSQQPDICVHKVGASGQVQGRCDEVWTLWGRPPCSAKFLGEGKMLPNGKLPREKARMHFPEIASD